MSTSLLGPMIVGLVAILFAPALLFATSFLEHLIALPEHEEPRGYRPRPFVVDRMDGEADGPPRVLARGVPDRPGGGAGLADLTRPTLRTA